MKTQNIEVGSGEEPGEVDEAHVVDEATHSEESKRDSRGGLEPLRQYLIEIGQVKLLEPEEEVTLAARIKKGDRAAREQMIKANLRLVVKMARDYDGIGLPILDLIGEGNVGLMKAVERFDPAKGGKFSTYGAWWIKQAIKRALSNQVKTVRLPIHMVNAISHMRRCARRLEKELGREPTEEELASGLDMTPLKLRNLKAAITETVHLDAPIGDDDATVADLIPNEGSENPAEALDRKLLSAQLERHFDRLGERYRTILNMRFGLESGRALTLDQVGTKFGLTRERIRQIQDHGLKKMREMIEEEEANGHCHNGHRNGNHNGSRNGSRH